MREILRYPLFYDLYITLIGGRKFFARYVNEFLKPDKDVSVLELGSGCGNIVPFIPKDVKYRGLDLSQKCVDYSKDKYPDADFVCQDITSDYPFEDKFDIIFSEGVMASLTDEQVSGMLENIVKHSAPDTKIVLSDMNYVSTNSFFQNYMLEKERGHNLRGREDYIRLFEKYVEIREVIELKDAFIIPNSKIVFICSPKQA